MPRSALTACFAKWVSRLSIKPLQRIILPKDGTVDPIAIILHNLLSVNAVKLVLPLVCAAAVGAILRRPKDTDVNVGVVDGGDLDLAEQVQSIRGIGNANGLEVGCGERR